MIPKARSRFARCAAARANTLPIRPLILPIEDGPPTFMYGDKHLEDTEAKRLRENRGQGRAIAWGDQKRKTTTDFTDHTDKNSLMYYPC